MGGEVGGERMYVYVWLGASTVRLKLSQHCWLAILQCKIKNLLLKKAEVTHSLACDDPPSGSIGLALWNLSLPASEDT